MNAFDFVVTIAIGTTLASTILDGSIALTDGLTALAVLIVLQFIISWLSSRSQKINRIAKSEPKLLCYKGDFIYDALKRERIVESEIMQSLRSKGYSSLEEADAVVLETNGNLSIINKLKDQDTEKSVLRKVKNVTKIK